MLKISVFFWIALFSTLSLAAEPRDMSKLYSKIDHVLVSNKYIFERNDTGNCEITRVYISYSDSRRGARAITTPTCNDKPRQITFGADRVDKDQTMADLDVTLLSFFQETDFGNIYEVRSAVSETQRGGNGYRSKTVKSSDGICTATITTTWFKVTCSVR